MRPPATCRGSILLLLTAVFLTVASIPPDADAILESGRTDLEAEPLQLNFGSVPLLTLGDDEAVSFFYDRPVMIRNSGDADFVLAGAEVRSDHTGAFELVGGPGPGQLLPAGERLTFWVRTSPGANGSLTGNLSVRFTSGDRVIVPLSCEGVGTIGASGSTVLPSFHIGELGVDRAAMARYGVVNESRRAIVFGSVEGDGFTKSGSGIRVDPGERGSIELAFHAGGAVGGHNGTLSVAAGSGAGYQVPLHATQIPTMTVYDTKPLPDGFLPRRMSPGAVPEDENACFMVAGERDGKGALAMLRIREMAGRPPALMDPMILRSSFAGPLFDVAKMSDTRNGPRNLCLGVSREGFTLFDGSAVVRRLSKPWPDGSRLSTVPTDYHIVFGTWTEDGKHYLSRVRARRDGGVGVLLRSTDYLLEDYLPTGMRILEMRQARVLDYQPSNGGIFSRPRESSAVSSGIDGAPAADHRDAPRLMTVALARARTPTDPGSYYLLRFAPFHMPDLPGNGASPSLVGRHRLMPARGTPKRLVGRNSHLTSLAGKRAHLWVRFDSGRVQGYRLGDVGGGWEFSPTLPLPPPGSGRRLRAFDAATDDHQFVLATYRGRAGSEGSLYQVNREVAEIARGRFSTHSPFGVRMIPRRDLMGGLFYNGRRGVAARAPGASTADHADVQLAALRFPAANLPPFLQVGPDVIVPADPSTGEAEVTLSASLSDPNGDPVQVEWIAPGISFDDPNSLTPTAMFPEGTTPVFVVGNDAPVTSARSPGARAPAQIESSESEVRVVLVTVTPPSTPVRPEDLAGFGLRIVGTNPFRHWVSMAYSIPRAAGVRLTAYDASGRRVGVLVDESAEAGDHRFDWDGTGTGGDALASGVYFLKLEWQGRSETARVVLLR